MPSKKQYPTFEEYMKNEYRGPYVATDIVIRYKKGIVLIQRKYTPMGLALPGGIAEHMPLPENAVKEAKEETGLEVILDDPTRPLCVLSDPKQDPRAFIISVAYTAKGKGILKPMDGEDAKSAKVYSLDEVHELITNSSNIFAMAHHKKILDQYLTYLTKSGNLRKYHGK